MDLTEKAADGSISGFKINYSAFYKVENISNKIPSQLLDNIMAKLVLGDHNKKEEKKDESKVAKNHYSLGGEFIYLFGKNPYLTSATGKVMITNNAVRFHKNFLFKKCGDLFNSMNLAVKFNVIYF